MAAHLSQICALFLVKLVVEWNLISSMSDRPMLFGFG